MVSTSGNLSILTSCLNIGSTQYASTFHIMQKREKRPSTWGDWVWPFDGWIYARANFDWHLIIYDLSFGCLYWLFWSYFPSLHLVILPLDFLYIYMWSRRIVWYSVCMAYSFTKRVHYLIISWSSWYASQFTCRKWQLEVQYDNLPFFQYQ